jgi:choice-of-anchor A domain-containing protein
MLLVCFAALLSAADASAGSILTPFNVIVSGGFTETSDDVGGGLAVGGNASVPGSFSIADNLNGEALSSFPGQASR